MRATRERRMSGTQLARLRVLLLVELVHQTHERLHLSKQSIVPVAARRRDPVNPDDGIRSKNRGGSTSVRGRVRSPHQR